CWAVTPNYCAEDGQSPCEELSADLNLDDAVIDYSCTDKAVKIHLSQWQTLIDTLPPIFDFCYPYAIGFATAVNNEPTNNALGYAENCLAPAQAWNHEEIQRYIRDGLQYFFAMEAELCNPTIYRVGSHDCAAEVFVPDVKVIDNCSGIHSVKAMIEVQGGIRSVALEKTGEEIRINEDGDTCLVVTFSHLSKPIRVPFNGCDSEPVEVRYEAADNCWNQSEWYKYIQIIDDVPPTVVVDREVNVTLNSKTEWVHAETFDEGSWDNCAIELMLARRSDWLTDTACVDLCADVTEPYDNWVDLLEDLGFDRNDVVVAVGGGTVFRARFDVRELSKFLDEGEVEQYYYNQIVWLWEDGQNCGTKVVYGWVYAIAAYLAENCSGTDEHGNGLRVQDLEVIFDHLLGIPGYGQELALLGGGWAKAVPFKCEDACEVVTAELLVMDYCCNWGTGWSDVNVEDKSNARLVKRLPDLAISCEAYNIFYKDVVEAAAQYGGNGSAVDTSGAFDDVDEAFGFYIKTWVDNQNRPTDIDGNLLPDSVINFDYWNVTCEEESEIE